MRRIWHRGQGSDLQIDVADNFWLRLRGLLGRPALGPGQALLIRPCSFVHTFGMRYPIDIVFLSRAGEILQVTEALPPGRIARCRKAHIVLELLSGQAVRHGLAPGTVLHCLN